MAARFHAHKPFHFGFISDNYQKPDGDSTDSPPAKEYRIAAGETQQTTIPLKYLDSPGCIIKIKVRLSESQRCFMVQGHESLRDFGIDF